MAYYRFYRRIPIIPGLLRLNIAKTGVSLSLGKKGWTITFGKHGVRLTKGFPGTGMSFSHNLKYKSQNKNSGLESENKVEKEIDFIGE